MVRRVVGFAFSALCLVVLCGLNRAIAAEGAESHSSDWYCTQGAEMLQAAQGYSQKTWPLQWNVDLLGRARADYVHCRDTSTGDPNEHDRALIGIVFTDLDIAEVSFSFALIADVGGEKASPSTFRHARELALWFARDALSVLNEQEQGSLSDNEFDLYSLQSQIAGRVEKFKLRIAKLSLSNIPRSMVELKAFLAANPEYNEVFRAGPNFEIPKSVLCRGQKRSASVVAQVSPDYSAVQVAPEDAKAVVVVGVGADNRVTSVHLQSSSGNDLVDEAALKAAYAGTYRAGSVNCNPVSGTVTLTFTYQ